MNHQVLWLMRNLVLDMTVGKVKILLLLIIQKFSAFSNVPFFEPGHLVPVVAVLA